jgi:TonB family protein
MMIKPYALIVTFAASLALFSLSINANTDNFTPAYHSYVAAVQSDLDESELALMAQDLVDLSATTFGEQHQNTINLIVSTANHFRNAKQFDEASKWYDKAIGLYDKTGQKDTEDYMLLLTDMLSNRQLFIFIDREKISSDLLPLLEHYFDNADSIESIVTSLRTLISISKNGAFNNSGRKLGRLSSQIIERAESELPATNYTLIEAQFIHAQVLKATKREEDAIEYFEKVVNVTDNSLNYTHPFELASHAQLVDLYESIGESEAATEHCLAIGRMKPWNDELDPVPLYRMNPEYPSYEARRGKDGSVTMQFDISPFGFVENVVVVEYEGGAGFKREALNALEKWRYAPKFVDGKPVTAEKQMVQLDFTLQKREPKGKLDNI